MGYVQSKGIEFRKNFKLNYNLVAKLQDAEESRIYVNKSTSKFVCIKKFTNESPEEFEEFIKCNQPLVSQADLSQLSAQNHKNLLEVYAYHYQEVPDFIEQCSTLYVFYEYFPTNMQKEIERRQQLHQSFSESEIWIICYCCISVLAYLEERGRFIGDIRPQNIGITSDGEIKLVPIKSTPYSMTNYEKTFKSQKKNQTYLSPELLSYLKSHIPQPAKYNAIKSDLYSLGMTLLYICLFQNPINNFYNYQLCEINEQALQLSVESICPKYSKLLSQIIILLLDYSDVSRPTATQLLDLLNPYQEQIKFKIQFWHNIEILKTMNETPQQKYENFKKRSISPLRDNRANVSPTTQNSLYNTSQYQFALKQDFSMQNYQQQQEQAKMRSISPNKIEVYSNQKQNGNNNLAQSQQQQQYSPCLSQLYANYSTKQKDIATSPSKFEKVQQNEVGFQGGISLLNRSKSPVRDTSTGKQNAVQNFAGYGGISILNKYNESRFSNYQTPRSTLKYDFIQMNTLNGSNNKIQITPLQSSQYSDKRDGSKSPQKQVSQINSVSQTICRSPSPLQVHQNRFLQNIQPVQFDQFNTIRTVSPHSIVLTTNNFTGNMKLSQPINQIQNVNIQMSPQQITSNEMNNVNNNILIDVKNDGELPNYQPDKLQLIIENMKKIEEKLLQRKLKTKNDEKN